MHFGLEVCSLLGYGATSLDDWCLTFQDSTVVSSSKVESPIFHWTFDPVMRHHIPQ